MDNQQYELFPEMQEKKDAVGMDSSEDSSSGLSIIPYLAVSEENQSNNHKQIEYKDLSPAQRSYVREAPKYEEKKKWESKAERFEKRNNYPFEWHLFELNQVLRRERGEETFSLEISPHSLIIKKSMYLPPIRQNQVALRSTISQYSMKSRKRFFEKLLTIDWNTIPSENIRELTLTYPSIYPKDGQVIKEQLDVYSKQIKRFCAPYGGVTFIWKMEFQRRGAPHYHLILITKQPIPLKSLRTWALKSWSRLVAKWINTTDYSEEEKQDSIKKHKLAGIEADKVRKSKQGLISYVVWYISKGSHKGKAKEHQHDVPEEYQNIGRWWGIYGKKSGVITFIKKKYILTEDEYDDFKDMILQTWEADGRKYKYRENQRMSYYNLNTNFDNVEQLAESDSDT